MRWVFLWIIFPDFEGLDFFRGCHIIVDSDTSRRWSPMTNGRLLSDNIYSKDALLYMHHFELLLMLLFFGLNFIKTTGRSKWKVLVMSTTINNPTIHGIIISCCQFSFYKNHILNIAEISWILRIWLSKWAWFHNLHFK